MTEWDQLGIIMVSVSLNKWLNGGVARYEYVCLGVYKDRQEEKLGKTKT